MKSVNEIKEFRKLWWDSPDDNNSNARAITALFNQVIAITERIEAHGRESIPTCIAPVDMSNVTVTTTCDTCRPNVERAAMIKALEWCIEQDRLTNLDIEFTIAHLRNGGEL